MNRVIHGLQPFRRRVNLELAHVLLPIQNLPLQVGHVHPVEIHQTDGPHARRRQIERQRRTQPAGPGNQNAAVFESDLALLAHLGEEKVAFETLALAGRQRNMHFFHGLVPPAENCLW